MTTTHRELDAKCRMLEPHYTVGGSKHPGFYALASDGRHRQDHTCTLSVHVFRKRHDDCILFHDNDKIIQRLMASSQFDRATFIVLAGIIELDARTALEICLS